MTVKDLESVLAAKFSIKYVSHYTGEVIEYSKLSRKEQAKLRNSRVYLIFPTNYPRKIEVVVYYEQEKN